METFRILFIDSYDSFTYNITRLLEHEHIIHYNKENEKTFSQPVQVITIHNDTFTTVDQLIPYLPLFNCIVLGPGPGNPTHGFPDIGIIGQLLKDERLYDTPILGICLGFQAMCYFQGAEIDELETIKHGQVCPITVCECDYKDRTGSCYTAGLSLFDGYPRTFKATRYHSLHVANYETNDCILPLAYTFDDENGELLMACKIKGRPWYGVQYHPESCCSELGSQLVSNFLNIAANHHISSYYESSSFSSSKLGAVELGLSSSAEDTRRAILELNRKIDKTPIFDKKKGLILTEELLNSEYNLNLVIKEYSVTKDPEFVVELADKIKRDKFVLASSKVLKNRGEWSIIALPERNSSLVLTHYETLKRTTIYRWQDPELTQSKLREYLQLEFDGEKQYDDGIITILKQDKNSFWDTMGSIMGPKIQRYKERCRNKNKNSLPFIGGLVGVLGYEMGLYVKASPPLVQADNLEKELSGTHLPVPDAKLVYIESCIVIDHRNGILYTVYPEDNSFPIPEFENLLTAEPQGKTNYNYSHDPLTLPSEIKYDITLPERVAYTEAFNKCQEFLHRGDSYEICLTTQTVVRPTQRLDPWRLFQTLVRRNPAPFSSFFVFNDLKSEASNAKHNNDTLCLVSTSPERFLKWDNNSTCELRPVKGTVKKNSIDMTYEKASNILKTPKEFGENLMILDLIRNDLHELLPKVKVEEFMAVEEYETVYQLVSVVKAYGIDTSPYSGIDILKHSLPPGSMTGAPKKATVELLQNHLENKLNRKVRRNCGSDDGTRGIYSGVTGYWSINDNSDWSVNIRCCYSYTNGSEWYLGAGGAITVLSTLEGELDEMFTKLNSNLQVFLN